MDTVTKILEQVVNKVAELPEAEQESLAQYLLEHFSDILDEAQWAQSFAESPDVLDQLAAEAEQSIHEDSTEPLENLWK